MSANCPIFVHALLTRSIAYPNDFKTKGNLAGKARCTGDDCQLWSSETQDCGLKHPSPTQKQNKNSEDGNAETSCPATIPEKDWNEQLEKSVDCPTVLPSEPE
jgi:hypothetical protein